MESPEKVPNAPHESTGRPLTPQEHSTSTRTPSPGSAEDSESKRPATEKENASPNDPEIEGMRFNDPDVIIVRTSFQTPAAKIKDALVRLAKSPLNGVKKGTPILALYETISLEGLSIATLEMLQRERKTDLKRIAQVIERHAQVKKQEKELKLKEKDSEDARRK